MAEGTQQLDPPPAASPAGGDPSPAPRGMPGLGHVPGVAGYARRGVSAGAQYLGVGGVLLMLVVYLTATQDQFFTTDNLINILETNSVLLIAAVGLTFVLLVGGFDLSLGGILALSGVVFYELLSGGMPPLLAVVLIVLGAGIAGLVLNGFLISAVGLSFLVVTLGTSSLFGGVALVATDGQTNSLPQSGLVADLGAGRIAGIPWAVVIAAAVFLLAVLVLRYTGYGRMVYATGGNPEAARLAGIDITRVRMSVYGIAAACTGLAAVLETTRLTAASPTQGATLALTAGAAVLLGGTTFMGGRGTQFGTLLGVLFLGVLSNGITLAGVSAFWQGIVSGTVLILALLLDRVRTRKTEP